ncbi:MAG: RNase adaptor protein RapZ [Deltaproteobacteria bacterium GWC2_55_46]|nr:MAG: RNase adaptor protein RapZ [Deltaproteobacteria bacterium GWA2_55_82]OGQ62224.1 MAG: RNase adaptor protein RapZ [Deltaproteobacteria bacterium RIFCSPLOWO2_02_FULL_55_12]OIJ75020.1 MAG: RNase adaptor protein RapZ [Deltaproteobacteria bacterium GWC2_55_46]
MRLVVLSGPSGSGKSTAIKALEDLGYYCVDNMPVALLPRFMELLARSGEIARVAAVIDVREREFLKDVTPVFSELKAAGCLLEVMYLEASDEVLARRFSETRRRHPLAAEESPLEGITRERDLLKEIKAHADRVFDTTEFNVHELRDLVKEIYSGPLAREKMALNLISFGYRYGVPTDADIIMDVRFLPNPYFVSSLQRLDGLDKSVSEYILSRDEAREFILRFSEFLGYLVPLYWKEGKSYLTVAIGCTGGRHRSVAIVEALSEGLGSEMVLVRKRHRDINK